MSVRGPFPPSCNLKEISFRDWSAERPVAFSRQGQLSFGAKGTRCSSGADRTLPVIAHDRCGLGCSGRAWNRINNDTYANELAGLINALTQGHSTVIHSTGG